MSDPDRELGDLDEDVLIERRREAALDVPRDFEDPTRDSLCPYVGDFWSED